MSELHVYTETVSYGGYEWFFGYSCIAEETNEPPDVDGQCEKSIP